MEGLDTSKPNIARIYDYWLGGKDNFAADREVAERIAAMWPPWVEQCRDNRKFVGRAVTWAANQGIGQYLDLGAGLPTSPSVHETARAVRADARVGYIDNDPVVVRHAEALMAGTGGVSAVQADLADPAGVLGSPDIAQTVDLAEPLCVIFAMVLHFFEAAPARAIARDYIRRLAPGSVVVISCSRVDDPELLERVRRDYTAGPVPNHSAETVLSFFEGLDLVPPGLALARQWRGGMDRVPGRSPGSAYVHGAAGVKPALPAS